ncbi:hypothetical protein [Streptomyces canus]|uniref:hypothetical protein n=1 Tax=Streptomyces canus TaxID=58343 RepID=UPI003869D5D0
MASWAKETGLPEDVALAAVKRTCTTRVAVAVDQRLIGFNGDLPPSTTTPRPSETD